MTDVLGTPGAPVPDPATPPVDTDPATTAAAPAVVVGEVVKHSWLDHIDGESSRFGIIVETFDADEAGGPYFSIAWLTGASGKIDADELEPV